MDIYEFINYRDFLKKLMKSFPKGGYGQLSRLASYLNINNAFLTQVFKETKSLSLEQALLTARFFNLTEKETDYFLLLVQFDKAGTKELKEVFLKKIKSIQENVQEIQNRVRIDVKLDLAQQAIFYSDWIYSAIRQSTAIPRIKTYDEIAEFLSLSPKIVLQTLEFLVREGLCKFEENQFKIGARRTHLEENSPFKKLHYQNWRNKGLSQFDDNWESKLYYSAPMTVSTKDTKAIRKVILEMIDRINEIADTSQSEELVCFNVDWFRINRT